MSRYTPEEQKILLEVARTAIEYGFEHDDQINLNIEGYNNNLKQILSCFVTLQLDGKLRGCIGTLEAHQPLVQDIADNAYAAAFADPRFPPLDPEEFKRVKIDISVLSTPEPLPVKSEEELLQKLRPDIDGLILKDKIYRATFLPAVWENLPDPKQFLSELKQKAGLQSSHWSDSIEFERYTADLIKEP